MPDILAINSAIDGLKALKEILKTAIATRDADFLKAKTAEMNEALLAVQSSALDARTDHSAMVDRVRELEAKLLQFETWETEKQRYELKSLPPGVFVYAIMESLQGSEPSHHICQTCYQRGKKSVLHQSEPRNGIYHLECAECGTDLKVGFFRRPSFDPDQLA